MDIINDILNDKNISGDFKKALKEKKECENHYDNSRDLLRFIMDVATTNSKADYNDDKVWRNEFQFIAIEIDEFLNG